MRKFEKKIEKKKGGWGTRKKKLKANSKSNGEAAKVKKNLENLNGNCPKQLLPAGKILFFGSLVKDLQLLLRSKLGLNPA